MNNLENEYGAIWATIAAVMKAVVEQGGITKGKKNQQQGWVYRGIDQLLDSLGPIFAAHGLMVVPTFSERTCEERESTKGGSLYFVTLRGTFYFVSLKDGSKVIATTYGEAMDSGDKATNKAMSIALKYALTQVLMLPFEVDEQEDDVAPPSRRKKAAQAERPQAKAGRAPTDRQRASIIGLMGLLNYQWPDIRDMVAELTGQRLDSYEDARAKLTPDQRAVVLKRLQEILADQRRPVPGPDQREPAPYEGPEYGDQ